VIVWAGLECLMIVIKKIVSRCEYLWVFAIARTHMFKKAFRKDT
jgi:hypothetical protein